MILGFKTIDLEDNIENVSKHMTAHLSLFAPSRRGA